MTPEGIISEKELKFLQVRRMGSLNVKVCILYSRSLPNDSCFAFFMWLCVCFWEVWLRVHCFSIRMCWWLALHYCCFHALFFTTLFAKCHPRRYQLSSPLSGMTQLISMTTVQIGFYWNCRWRRCRIHAIRLTFV